MRILYVLHETSMFSGSSKSFINMLSCIIDNGVEPILVFPNTLGLANYYRNKGMRIFVIPYTYNIRPNCDNFKDRLLFTYRYLKRKTINKIASNKLTRIAKELEVDIIHSNTSAIDIGFNVAKKLDIKHITHIREYGELDHWMHIYGMKRRFEYKWSYAIAITKGILEYRCPFGDVNRFKVIYNPIVSKNEIRYSKTKKDYFLYVGRIDETKGIVDLIETYIDYVKKNKDIIPLKIAGTINGNCEKLYSRLTKIIKDSDAEPFIEWLGERNDVADLMYYARATIVPSFFEGFGRVLAEAMANGCLTIGRDTGGTSEQFDNGVRMIGKEIGLRFRNRSELVRHLIDVTHTSPEKYENMIISSQRTIDLLYTKESYSEKITQFYREIMESSK